MVSREGQGNERIDQDVDEFGHCDSLPFFRILKGWNPKMFVDPANNELYGSK